ncbi:MAG: hypothetical protein ACK5NT_04840 [Pyrinomonadaceae bacterium]
MSGKSKNSNLLLPSLIWALVLLAAFFYFRSDDLGRLNEFGAKLFHGPMFGSGIAASFIGIAIGVLVILSWFGFGAVISTRLRKYFGSDDGENPESNWVLIAEKFAVGAALWSVIFFFVGALGFYSKAFAIIAIIFGIALAAFNIKIFRGFENNEKQIGKAVTAKVSFVLIGLLLLISALASTAPPIAKDTLLYHFAVPKAFIAQGSIAPIAGNIASYLALGTEMHVVWAMLAGEVFSPRIGEVAAGFTVFAFFPILLMTIYGWAREFGLQKTWATIAVLLFASIPSAFHVAASAYIDLALALFITLAIRTMMRWWKTLANVELGFLALFLGAALSIKLTAVFTAVALGLVILLRARKAEENDANPTQVFAKGSFALIAAGIFAASWYIRDWVLTGSPVFPFYMNVWKGTATGWDVERSMLFQIMNSRYGGAAKGVLEYILAPFHISFMAQPEQPAFFDGVLGVGFLFGIPLLFLAWRKKLLPTELKLGVFVSAILFLFWLFTSQQLRYLLPIFPVLAIAICVSTARLSKDQNQKTFNLLGWIFVAIGFVGFLVSFCWFAQKDPVQVFFGGETRDQYLTRNLDYYPFYLLVNEQKPADARVWLINMRRDTYNLNRPYFSDYLFEDWTIKQLAEDSANEAELRKKVNEMGITFILARYDVLLDYDRSTLVDVNRDETVNKQKIEMVRNLLLEGNVLKKDNRFSLVRVSE